MNVACLVMDDRLYIVLLNGSANVASLDGWMDGWIFRHANPSGYFMPKTFLFLFGIIFMRIVI